MTIGKIEKKQWASCSCGKWGFLGQSKKKKKFTTKKISPQKCRIFNISRTKP